VGLGLELMPVMLGIGHVVLGVLALIVAKFAKGVLSPYRTDEELTARDNPAFGLVLAGYYGAVVTIYIGVARALPLDAGSAEVAVALASNLAWTMGGIIALNLSRTVMNSLLVSGARCSDEVVKNRNTAAGAVECGLYVASGIVLAGALREPGGTWLTAIVFFVLSQLVLLVLGRVYQRFAGYGIAKEICGGNLAAGVAFGLTLVALSLLMLKATSGEFLDWGTNLTFFAFDAVVGFAMLMALRWLTDLALLPNARIAEEIVRDRNVNVGLVEGTIAVAVSLLILFVF
jgi:uncharacterized membrane protein YjfL (UPF0719 family)